MKNPKAALTSCEVLHTAREGAHHRTDNITNKPLSKINNSTLQLATAQACKVTAEQV